MTRRFALERDEIMGDGGGGGDRAWRTIGWHWGAVAGAPGKIEDDDAVARSRTLALVRLWARPHGDVGRPCAGDRLREGRRLFRILAVAEDDPAGRFLVCRVEEEATR
jgi:head-tail adaptor